MHGVISFLLMMSGGVAMVFTVLWTIRRARKKNRFSPFTEKSLRPPGYSLALKFDDQLADLFALLVGGMLFPLVYVLVLPQLTDGQAYLIGFLCLLFWLYGVYKIIRLVNQLQILRLGLDGEVYTGQELNYLMREGAYVYHDIPYKYGNIDHVIVATGGVFAVETKAVRKPANDIGKRQSEVTYKQGRLIFPHRVDGNPIDQAQRHADHLSEALSARLGESVSVIPVVAIPGWYVKNQTREGVVVVNPKRGKSLKWFVNRSSIAPRKVTQLAVHIEEFARTVQSRTDKTDPDADQKYTFWLDRKAEEKMI